MRQIGLVSFSTDPDITRPALERIAAAITTQLLDHLSSFHQILCVDVRVYDRVEDFPPDTVLLGIFDDADQAGDLGYHSVTPWGEPYARVFWKPIKAAGGTLMVGSMSLSVVLSHEACELEADVYANLWADQTANTQIAWEVCDPVEADSYEIDGVSVSNFVGPRWFRQGPGPYDWMRKLDQPWARSPGGYVIQRQNGTITMVGLAELPEHVQRSKAHPASRTMRRAG